MVHTIDIAANNPAVYSTLETYLHFSIYKLTGTPLPPTLNQIQNSFQIHKDDPNIGWQHWLHIDVYCRNMQ